MTLPRCALVLACVSIATSAAQDQAVHCEEEQWVEVGQAGRIRCNITFDFKAVFWRNIHNNTNPIAWYNRIDDIRNGDGYENGKFSILEGGDLVINNVTTKHESTYQVQVFDDRDASVKDYVELKTFIRSNQERPNIDQCHEPLCYQRHTDRATLKCYFNSARPPATVQFYMRTARDGYIQMGTGDDQVAEPNDDGTFNSSIAWTIDNSQSLSLWVCRSTWLSPDYMSDSSVVVDFLSDEMISEAPAIAKRSKLFERFELHCGDSGQSPVPLSVWRKLISSTSVVTIGVQAYGNTETVNELNGLTIKSSGDLEFRYADLSNEGIYVCIYHNGEESRITKFDIRVLILPTPKYPVVDGCDEIKDCRLSIADHRRLDCSLTGVRPTAQLSWEVNTGYPLELRHEKHQEHQRGDRFDVSVSALFKVTRDIYCDDEIVVACVVTSGDVSHLLVPREVTLVPEECKRQPSSPTNIDRNVTQPQSNHHPSLGPLIIALMICLTILGMTIICMCGLVKYLKYKARNTGKSTDEELRQLRTPETDDPRVKPEGRSKESTPENEAEKPTPENEAEKPTPENEAEKTENQGNPEGTHAEPEKLLERLLGRFDATLGPGGTQDICE